METNMTLKSKENPSRCYQCGKCSAGCPIAEDMDLLPHQVMHYLSIGMTDKAMKANTCWMCTGCFTCAVRCPNDIDITTVMDDLRAAAIEKGLPCPKPSVLTFHRNFIRDLSRRGRIHELRMMGEYNLLSGNLFNNATKAPRMFLRRRLRLMPPKSVKGFSRWIQRAWKNK